MKHVYTIMIMLSIAGFIALGAVFPAVWKGLLIGIILATLYIAIYAVVDTYTDDNEPTEYEIEAEANEARIQKLSKDLDDLKKQGFPS